MGPRNIKGFFVQINAMVYLEKKFLYQKNGKKHYQ